VLCLIKCIVLSNKVRSVGLRFFAVAKKSNPTYSAINSSQFLFIETFQHV